MARLTACLSATRQGCTEGIGPSLRRRVVMLCVAIAVTAGCATTPKEQHREPSFALSDPSSARLGQLIARQLREYPDLSGFLPLSNGLDAYIARIIFADAAEKTLDLQYYIFRGDLTGMLVLDRLITAADRGVRVRLLVDDFGSQVDRILIASLSAHPNIEVRVFNPLSGKNAFSRVWSYVRDFSRVNQRMHNKMFVADNAIGVAGGRNIGDEYFSAASSVNFVDLDLLAAGPVVQDLSRSFDEYWNSQWAVPVEYSVPDPPGAAGLDRTRLALGAHRAAVNDSEYARRLRESDLLKRLLAGNVGLIWAPARVVSDKPGKVAAAGKPAPEQLLGAQVRQGASVADAEFLVISPYFVPGMEGVAFFAKLREKGVRVRILTNSFAANDVAVVHSGYARYRKDLLKIGAELFEIKRSLSGSSKKDYSFAGSSGASLHAKAFLADRERLFVGSMNLDPRSIHLNTELGIVVNSPQLGETFAEQFDRAVDPRYSYRLELTPDGTDIVWISREEGKDVCYDTDPHVGFWRRFGTGILGIFAPESLL